MLSMYEKNSSAPSSLEYVLKYFISKGLAILTTCIPASLSSS